MRSPKKSRIKGNLLIIEDDQSLRSSLTSNLELYDFTVQSCGNAKTAFKILAQHDFELIICDFHLPDTSGIDFIVRTKQIAPKSAILLTSGIGQSPEILKIIEAGADDFLAKPFSTEDLLFTVQKILFRRLHLKMEALQTALRLTPTIDKKIPNPQTATTIVAKSKAMLEIFETVNRLANFNTTVLIIGESGTGKELIAKAIHDNSPRRGRPFVAINCGAIPEMLIESELFGHKKGAFTDAIRDKAGLFEEASGGTIFLDEIGELPIHLQVKLLRTLQEQQIRRVGDDQLIGIDVRVIAATLRDLEQDVNSGRFRDDLFYRLNVVTIFIPPLRERPEDIPALIEHFMKKHSSRLGIQTKKLSPDALDCLLGHCWRGNVRELENCLEGALVLSEGDTITKQDLPEQLLNSQLLANIAIKPTKSKRDNLSIKQQTRELEIELILRALDKTHGNRTHAAKILEISHRALLYKIKEYQLER